MVIHKERQLGNSVLPEPTVMLAQSQQHNFSSYGKGKQGYQAYQKTSNKSGGAKTMHSLW